MPSRPISPAQSLAHMARYDGHSRPREPCPARSPGGRKRGAFGLPEPTPCKPSHGVVWIRGCMAWQASMQSCSMIRIDAAGPGHKGSVLIEGTTVLLHDRQADTSRLRLACACQDRVGEQRDKEQRQGARAESAASRGRLVRWRRRRSSGTSPAVDRS